MTRDEFERLKETEKAHLRKLKELKQMLGSLRRTHSSRQALDDMTASSRDVLDETDELVTNLSRDAALTEARVDMALSAEEERTTQADAEKMEEELRKARAEALVRQMRQEITTGSTDDPASVLPSPTPAETDRAPIEKTLGRPVEQPKEQPEGEERKALPEKTIGRMRP